MGLIEDYDKEMKMMSQFSHHVETRYELAVAGPEKAERWLSVTKIGTLQGPDHNSMRQIPSSVVVQAVPAFPAEVKNESEALDVVE